MRRTPRGELTVNIATLSLIAKALRTPPEKYHGVTDVELRYRKRYLDFIANEENREKILTRSRLISATRRFLEARGFVEVETPMLHPIYGGAAARPFRTHHNTLDMDLFLRIAPELYLKRLIVGGVSHRVYEINLISAQPGHPTRHNPEFTMLELYQAYADWEDMLNLLEDLIGTVMMDLTGATTATIEDQTVSFAEALPAHQHGGVPPAGLAKSTSAPRPTWKACAPKCKRRSATRFRKTTNWGQLVELVFEEQWVVATIIEATYVVDFPSDISPLSKRSPGRPAHRGTVRDLLLRHRDCQVLGNERSRPAAQHIRGTVPEPRMRRASPTSSSTRTSWRRWNAPCRATGGLGLGIDRLAMIGPARARSAEVIAFPTVRPV